MTSRGKRYTNRLHAEATRWQDVAGEPTAADSAGPYSNEQLVHMDSDFVGAVERAFASGGEAARPPMRLTELIAALLADDVDEECTLGAAVGELLADPPVARAKKDPALIIGNKEPFRLISWSTQFQPTEASIRSFSRI